MALADNSKSNGNRAAKVPVRKQMSKGKLPDTFFSAAQVDFFYVRVALATTTKITGNGATKMPFSKQISNGNHCQILFPTIPRGI